MHRQKTITFCKNDVMISRYGDKVTINLYPTHKITAASKARLEDLQSGHKVAPLTLFDPGDNSEIFTVWHWQG